ncbi:hypothetical protein QUF61_00420 [Candidatus Venteria ishoeyi]|uniref:hypothetical protein n=1 Tax=Candidatus Venteria ishoeyi TaxID=1899563 RepID=UPI0025A67724|nr:hypothetical protein [Candidatus Venteria ishoeyi]MDM8544933.1 hypothetical protein [Candidatus Venteria ishoeyi]
MNGNPAQAEAKAADWYNKLGSETPDNARLRDFYQSIGKWSSKAKKQKEKNKKIHKILL